MCFYVECLKVTGWTVFREVRIAEPQVLPIVLSREEVKEVLSVVREPRFRTCLGLMYHCGLRVGEAVRVQVKDIIGRENPPRLLVSRSTTRACCLRTGAPWPLLCPAAHPPRAALPLFPTPQPSPNHFPLTPTGLNNPAQGCARRGRYPGFHPQNHL